MTNNDYRVRKAKALAIVIVCGFMVSGLFVGSWLIPTALVLVSNGRISYGDFPLEANVFPHPPAGWELKFGRQLQTTLEIAIGSMGLAGAALFSWIGGRLNHYLVVQKLHWLNEEDVKNLNRRQWM